MELKLDKLIEQDVPVDMARRLVVLGDATLAEKAVEELQKTGEWRDTAGGGVWRKETTIEVTQ